jgi:hypothetical protein
MRPLLLHGYYRSSTKDKPGVLGIKSFAWLQPRQLERWAFFPSGNLLLQYGGVEGVFFSIHSLCMCFSSVYTPYSALYSYIPFRCWWRFFLMSAMFFTIRVHELEGRIGTRTTSGPIGDGGRKWESASENRLGALVAKCLLARSILQNLGEENTKAGKSKGRVNERTGFFPLCAIAWRSSPPCLFLGGLAGRPSFVMVNEAHR